MKSLAIRKGKPKESAWVSDQETSKLMIWESKSLRSSKDKECVPGEGSGRNTVLSPVFRDRTPKLFRPKLRLYPIENEPKNEHSQLGLTYQTCDFGHEIMITPLKKNIKHN